ncbi:MULTISPECIES: NAD-dependent epimerase/dehydratase family protein [Gammaproteobacteria]|uniref:NAD-dependent epimerase/dehydratase family protein n=1 Tax=Gammaproteobacteria TaxID=1236 RepID=UPI000DD0E494|nr:MULTISPECIES: NAD-dependent epimerase/dehydratase family protein [Gammaproteobacteria]RTE85857.1 NAD-dependent epimerase/dehydratase family protein [Aliidiomarina sp. B3213]TCZ90143.1 NAD-dependent epimerase/dehydratase family protein [Lysobacter sp. N42]
MQTILGATGQIGTELARSLHRDHTDLIRLVSRNPKPLHETDELIPADLLDAESTLNAVKGSKVVYLTAGLPMDTARWVREWPVIMTNVLRACEQESAKLVFFDNTYMYPQTSLPQTEETKFQPYGKKGEVRAQITNQMLEAMSQSRIEGMICRAPEFYGPGKTQSITNATILENIAAGKPAKVFVSADTKRSLIYTPDASRAMALLGNTADAFGETWHLPCDDNRLTYREFIELAGKASGQSASFKVIKKWQLKLAGLFNSVIRDAGELLPRYETDNVFMSEKFKNRFPKFEATTFEKGLMEYFSEVREKKDAS